MASAGSSKLYEAVPKMGAFAAVRRGATTLLDAAGSEDLLTYDMLVKEFGLIASEGHASLRT